jgi:hypothetical protein
MKLSTMLCSVAATAMAVWLLLFATETRAQPLRAVASVASQAAL